MLSKFKYARHFFLKLNRDIKFLAIFRCRQTNPIPKDFSLNSERGFYSHFPGNMQSLSNGIENDKYYDKVIKRAVFLIKVRVFVYEYIHRSLLSYFVFQNHS